MLQLKTQSVKSRNESCIRVNIRDINCYDMPLDYICFNIVLFQFYRVYCFCYNFVLVLVYFSLFYLAIEDHMR